MAKKDDEMKSELADLREQLEASKKTGDEGNTEEKSGEEPADEETSADLSDQIHEFIGGLNQDLKDANPMTLLAVFALGVLMGRMLSK